MSKLGNVNNSFGKQLNISIANTYSYILMNSTNLPSNTIIISSAVNNYNIDDIGSYSMVVTDNEGNPVRLTYCIQEGNGLQVSDNNKDVIYLNIDNETIQSGNSGLYIDLSNYNHNSIYNNDNILYVDTSKIDNSTSKLRGVISIDDISIKTSDDAIYVSTEKLSYSDNSTSTYGIISSGDKMFNINNGVISLNINNLPHASNDNYGVVKGDESSISCNGDYVKVNTDKLKLSSKDEYGIIAVDNNKIISNNGVLSVNSSNLNNATNLNKGTISIDNISVQLNKDNQIMVNNYLKMFQSLNKINDEIKNAKKTLDDIKNNILTDIK